MCFFKKWQPNGREAMDFHSVRSELRRLGSKNLFKMLMSQKESKCILNGICSFHFRYKEYSFCLSEVLGKGCEVERVKQLEEEICRNEGGPISRENVEAPLFDCMRRLSYNFIKGGKGLDTSEECTLEGKRYK